MREILRRKPRFARAVHCRLSSATTMDPDALKSFMSTLTIDKSRKPVVDGECWGCGKKDTERSFKSCVKCREKNIKPSAKFCSQACMEANWSDHKKWHKEQVRVAEACKLTTAKFAAASKPTKIRDGDKYGQHYMAAHRLIDDGRYRDAAK